MCFDWSDSLVVDTCSRGMLGVCFDSFKDAIEQLKLPEITWISLLFPIVETTLLSFFHRSRGAERLNN